MFPRPTEAYSDYSLVRCPPPGFPERVKPCAHGNYMRVIVVGCYFFEWLPLFVLWFVFLSFSFLFPRSFIFFWFCLPLKKFLLVFWLSPERMLVTLWGYLKLNLLPFSFIPKRISIPNLGTSLSVSLLTASLEKILGSQISLTSRSIVDGFPEPCSTISLHLIFSKANKLRHH